MSRAGSLAVAALLAACAPAAARAHHGTAAVSAAGAEGPGAALDTTSPLPLGRGTLLVLVKAELVPFQRRDGFEEPKRWSSFNTLALGYGLTPWLSAFVLQPYNAKAQDGVGTNAGLGDTNLMLAASLKWDEGLRAVPERESLDELEDWHLGVWLASSVPVGPTTHRDDAGAPFAPDMQTGFAGPSPSAGLAALKQLSPDVTLLAEASYQHFLAQRYARAGYRYRFGGETRVNAALVWRALARGDRRVDVAPELSLLDLQRDRSDAGGGGLRALEASGGTIVYGQLGARATLGAVSIGLALRRAVARALHEGGLQQGAEGLEAFRASVTVAWAGRG